MFHGNGDYSYWGMHLIWWILWILFLVWIFATPYDIPGQRKKVDPLEILKKRYAAGEIDTKEYEERKKILERDSQKSINN